MKIYLGNQEIELIPEEVKAAKKIASAMFKTTKERSIDSNVPSLYFTTIVISYLMANDLINALTPDALATILNAAAMNHKKWKEEKKGEEGS